MKFRASFNRTIPRWLSRAVLAVAISLILIFAVRFMLPIYRIPYQSRLIMLGDFNNDHHWSQSDTGAYQAILANPFAQPVLACARADVNNNGLLDVEDLEITTHLFAFEDPYLSEAKAVEAGRPFPRPRELYRYLSSHDYVNRPLYALPYRDAVSSPIHYLSLYKTPLTNSAYACRLNEEIYDEAVCCDIAYRLRLPGLTSLEREYASNKISKCNMLYTERKDYDLLLELIGMTEDCETLTTAGQDPFVLKFLTFRDHLRELLQSSLYNRFKTGQASYQDILHRVESCLQQDLGLVINLEKLGPPRDLSQLENYLTRTEWQYYKSRTKTQHFEQLILFAQHDRRYLRAVARTSRKHADPGVENHNLPMMLLFREALRITGDKKAAVGLLDESIRIPFFWVKSIPRNLLPSSLALENFLLPGNKEDGADKSRHWNVFGGICLYKSPTESLDLALKREIQDLREDRYSVEGMTEFIRDLIADLNGIYHVVSVNPQLYAPISSSTAQKK